MRAREHVVSIAAAPSPTAEPRSNWTRWVCTCGGRSRLFGYPGFAEMAGRSHAAAHGGRMAVTP